MASSVNRLGGANLRRRSPSRVVSSAGSMAVGSAPATSSDPRKSRLRDEGPRCASEGGVRTPLEAARRHREGRQDSRDRREDESAEDQDAPALENSEMMSDVHIDGVLVSVRPRTTGRWWPPRSCSRRLACGRHCRGGTSPCARWCPGAQRCVCSRLPGDELEHLALARGERRKLADRLTSTPPIVPRVSGWRPSRPVRSNPPVVKGALRGSKYVAVDARPCVVPAAPA